MGHSTMKVAVDLYYHYLEGGKEKAGGDLLSFAGV